MTLLSIIATIAAFLVGVKFTLSEVLPILLPQNASAWQKIWIRTINWFYLNQAPIWKKIFLRVIFSALMVTAIGGGLYDTYMSLSPETHFFWRGVFSVGFMILSLFGIAVLYIVIISPKETLSRNYLKLDFCNWNSVEQIPKIRKRRLILNSTILCLWLVVLGLCLYLDKNLFISIGISIMITAFLCLILTGIGLICYILIQLFKIIVIYPIRNYIKWLLK